MQTPDSSSGHEPSQPDAPEAWRKKDRREHAAGPWRTIIADDSHTTPSPEPERQEIVAGGDSLTPLQRAIHRLFIGQDGVRAVWRLAAAVALFMVIETVLGMAVLGNHPVYRWLRSQPRGVLSPLLLFLTESVGVGAALLTGLAMSKLEGRTFADYGTPWREALGKRFWQGVMFGFAMLGLLMASIAAGHGFSLGGRALGVREAIWFGAQYAVGFLLVGFFEEGTFRGYMQATLGADIGFWPAALILSAWFELIHVRNSGEAIVGLFMAGCFGLLACFSLWRTGNIWFAIGMHAAWDWGQTFFLGVPDSGATATGHLMNSSLHGPVWLAGGTAGPEGSVFVFGVMALAAVALYFVFPSKGKTAEPAGAQSS